MKAILATMALAGVMLTSAPALAADPSPSPKGLPIRGVTVDVQQNLQAPADLNGADHIEAPPFAAPRQMRMAPETANEMAAPAPAGRPARAKAAAPKPSPSPSPSPSPKAR